MNNMASSPSAAAAVAVQLPELIQSLEQATLMAKQLPVTIDPNHLLQIYSSLHQAHHHLSSFISPPQPLPAPAAPDNSLSSATGMADVYGDEPMQVGDDDNEENNSKATIDKVEEKMRGFHIKNKRAKRPLSPSSVADERRLVDDDLGDAKQITGFDPHATRLRSLDLIYQFHG